ncbi:cation-translocating P-type ATPase [Georgenia satyanarayanai]|uniref:cation-translocating P-type ATPase n=1 Tax=Georgenia satyanarayanai TaxID=860221 RepID=UPI0012649D43|nr:HAD-IC family P-type ATPase [Georgenia satyanarayanai]
MTHATSHRQESGDRPLVSVPHARDVGEVLAELEVDPDRGLPAEATRARLAIYGGNRLPQAERESWLGRLLRQFHDPMIYVLVAAGVLTALLGEWIDTTVILAVVVINALIGFVQEGRAEGALEGLRDMLSLDASVRREGAWRTVPAEDLVPGDVVRLGPGDKVPADLRLLHTAGLRVEESALTGESVPTAKASEPVEAHAGIGDRRSMGFSGTVVVAGSGTGVVTATGTDTQIGHISTLLDEVETLETPLTREMTAFSKRLSLVVVVLAALMFGVSAVLHNHTAAEVTLAAIGFAVAAIPEGLPAVLTITLALGVQKMAGRNAITRRMNSVQTLGSVTVICSDKTGTLTRNEMTVRAVVTPVGRYDVGGTGYAPDGGIYRAGTPALLEEAPDLCSLAEVAARANDAAVEERDGQWLLSGEPTDGALRTFGLKAGFPAVEQARVAVVPFDSDYKYMATLDDTGDRGLVVHLKGAPDRILDRCDTQGTGLDDTEPLDRQRWEHKIDELGAQGLRVLAGAARHTDRTDLTTDDVDGGGFTLLGLYGILDPPREEAIDAIRQCREAGIAVKMITGDHIGTAAAIGREMGIGDRAVTGTELEGASDGELGTIAAGHDIFARTSPEHKLRLVRALQAQHHVVSMTGDGVNDAPSLKQADVGVAMGIKGTEATKDAADIVLADDNFASIEAAVEMGRTIDDNLRKAIVFLLPTNGAQGLVIFVALLLGITLPLTPVQVLWVNMITAVTLSLALAFEPSEPGIMSRPPRTPGGSILTRASLARIGYVSLLIGGATMAVFLLGERAGADLEVSRTVAINTLVLGQIFYLLASRFGSSTSLRRELVTSNPISWVFITLMLVLQLLFVYTPFMQVAFDSAAVTVGQWSISLAVGVAVFVVVELDKALERR